MIEAIGGTLVLVGLVVFIMVTGYFYRRWRADMEEREKGEWIRRNGGQM